MIRLVTSYRKTIYLSSMLSLLQSHYIFLLFLHSLTFLCRYEDMIRLVTSYRKDLLTETHLHLAQQLETEGSFKLSEKHYVEASDWGSAVNMYAICIPSFVYTELIIQVISS